MTFLSSRGLFLSGDGVADIAGKKMWMCGCDRCSRKDIFYYHLFFGYEHMPPAVVASQRSLSGHNHTSFSHVEIGTPQSSYSSTILYAPPFLVSFSLPSRDVRTATTVRSSTKSSSTQGKDPRKGKRRPQQACTVSQRRRGTEALPR